MKRRVKQKAFIEELQGLIEALRKMQPGETHVISINANYGHYQLMIVPAADNPKKAGASAFAIEINGEIHHLFVSPHSISAYPSKKQVIRNMQNTVIMRGLSIHIRDPKGDGKHVMRMHNGNNGIQAREYINLAGNIGSKLIDEIKHSDKASLKTYRIIQKDILKALKEKQRSSQKYLS